MLRYADCPPLANPGLNELFAAAWPGWKERDFRPVLQRSLGYVGAFEDERLIGYVNVAWDGGVHAFLLDPTVHPNYRRRGIGTRLVKGAIRLARQYRAEWLHVDFEQRLAGFYSRCGFQPTAAGLLRLSRPQRSGGEG